MLEKTAQSNITANKKSYSVTEIGQILGISRPTAYGLINKNEFQSVHMSSGMAIHSLLDYQIDKEFAENADTSPQIVIYIDYFCKIHEERLK